MLFLIAAVVLVPISHRLRMGATLGYLIAGILLGPSGFGFVTDTESIFHFSEFGVIFLMFVIGLELQPNRLWVLRRSVFGLGSLQMILTCLVVMALALSFGLQWQMSLVLGLGISMSSTALVLQSLGERKQLNAQHGRDAFSILLFQDLAVIPILALLPVLGQESTSSEFHWQAFALPLVVIVGFVGIGRLLLKPIFRAIASVEDRDLFTSATLLMVIASAVAMNEVGLSMGLGAFLSGVLLADSEYRHELEADIAPFKGLLLGLFFMAIGMGAKISLLWDRPLVVFPLVLGLFVVKGSLIFGMRKLLGASVKSSRKLAVFLSQGGEFAFVLFAAAASAKILDLEISNLFTVVVTVSMFIAPLLFVVEDRLSGRKEEVSASDYDSKMEQSSVVIAGFGRFGQITARLLALRKIPFTALDKNSSHVDFVRKFGNKIFYGDATRLDLLMAAKVQNAKIFILAIDEVEESIKTAEMVRRHFPHVPIYARARNRFHAYKLMDLGISVIYRETFLSGLEMGYQVLVQLGMKESRAKNMVEKFRLYDEETLLKQYAVYQNEEQLIQTTQQATAELQNLFESDQAEKDEFDSGITSV
jgi:monovalent cation:proton antiporter-2 (CPA2) family protein